MKNGLIKITLVGIMATSLLSAPAFAQDHRDHGDRHLHGNQHHNAKARHHREHRRHEEHKHHE